MKNDRFIIFREIPLIRNCRKSTRDYARKISDIPLKKDTSKNQHRSKYYGAQFLFVQIGKLWINSLKEYSIGLYKESKKWFIHRGSCKTYVTQSFWTLTYCNPLTSRVRKKVPQKYPPPLEKIPLGKILRIIAP